MIVEETFFRRSECSRESRRLPAPVYNLARVLLAHAPEGCLFVPIRAMQYLAVLEDEEFIFVDREGGRFIELAWRGSSLLTGFRSKRRWRTRRLTIRQARRRS